MRFKGQSDNIVTDVDYVKGIPDVQQGHRCSSIKIGNRTECQKLSPKAPDNQKKEALVPKQWLSALGLSIYIDN